MNPSQQTQTEKPRRASRARTESTAIRQALKAAGYEARVKHGTGTAASWIEATISGIWTDREFRDQHYGKAFGIIKKVSGREHLEDDIQTDLFMVKILLSYAPRQPTPEEYAAMTREQLDARADDLRTDLRRWEGIGVTSGQTFDRTTADLAATVTEIAARADPAPAPSPEPEPERSGRASIPDVIEIPDRYEKAPCIGHNCACMAPSPDCPEYQRQQPDAEPGGDEEPAREDGDLSCTLGELAREAVGEAYVVLSELGKDTANVAIPIVFDLVGQAAARAYGGKVKSKDVGQLLEAATNAIKAWMLTPEESRPCYPAVPPLPIADTRIDVSAVAEEIVKVVAISADRAAKDGDIMQGFIVAALGKAVLRHMLGSLIAYLRGGVVDAEEVDEILSDAAQDTVRDLKEQLAQQLGIAESEDLEPQPMPAEGGGMRADCYHDLLDGYA